MLQVLRQLVEAEILAESLRSPTAWPPARTPRAGSSPRPPCSRRIRPAPAAPAAAEPGDRLGDDVEMLAGLQRQRHAGSAPPRSPAHMPAQFTTSPRRSRRPRRPAPRSRRSPGRPPADPGDLHALGDPRAPLPRPLRQRQRDVGRIGLPVLRQMDRRPSRRRCSAADSAPSPRRATARRPRPRRRAPSWPAAGSPRAAPRSAPR